MSYTPSHAELKKDKEELRQLIRSQAYFEGKFILSSGKESDYYIDARLITLQPKGAFLIAKLMLDMIKDVSYDAIGGPTLGADPLIGAIGVVSFQQGKAKPTFIVRKEAKAHGKGKLVEGPDIQAGAKVVVIDDVATTGKAFLHSIDVFSSLNIQVARCLAIVDRNQGAPQAVKDKGSQMMSIFDIEEIRSK